MQWLQRVLSGQRQMNAQPNKTEASGSCPHRLPCPKRTAENTGFPTGQGASPAGVSLWAGLRYINHRLRSRCRRGRILVAPSPRVLTRWREVGVGVRGTTVDTGPVLGAHFISALAPPSCPEASPPSALVFEGFRHEFWGPRSARSQDACSSCLSALPPFPGARWGRSEPQP